MFNNLKMSRRWSITREREDNEDEDQGYETLTTRRRQKKFQCSICGYKSDRRYNVLRHERRIHVNKIRRECCGLRITTKGEWYRHCESSHPGRQPPVTYKKDEMINSRSLSYEEDSSDASDVSEVSSSPQNRRYSVRIREMILKTLEPASQEQFTPYFREQAMPQDLSVRRFQDRQNVSQNSEQMQTSMPQNLGLDTFIQEIPLKILQQESAVKMSSLPPTSEFLRSLEHSELSEDSIFTEDNTEETVLPPEEIRCDQVTLVLQEITHTRTIWNGTGNYNNNINDTYMYGSSISSLLWKVGEGAKIILGQSLGNLSILDDQENQLPPKKKILKKFLDRENTLVSQDENKEVGVQIWNEITEMQREFLSCIDFDRYKL